MRPEKMSLILDWACLGADPIRVALVYPFGSDNVDGEPCWICCKPFREGCVRYINYEECIANQINLAEASHESASQRSEFEFHTSARVTVVHPVQM
jgi:hypothetical protein